MLWSGEMMLRWATTTAVAAVVLLACWAWVSGEGRFQDQRVGLSLAIVATAGSCLVSATLLLSGRRAIGVRRLALLGELPVRTTPVADASPAARAGLAPDVPSSAVLVASERLVRFHRADCPMAAGRGYAEALYQTHRDAGRLPCGVCRP